MQKLIAFLLVILSVSGCKNAEDANTHTITGTDSLRIIREYEKQKKITDKGDDHISDSLYQVLLNITQLPSIKKMDHEAYLFIWGKVPFAQPDYLYLLEIMPDKTYSLTTKCFYESNDTSAHDIQYKNRRIILRGHTLLETTRQQVSENEWRTFKRKLEGSYYWALQDPCPSGDCIVDGESWILETMSDFCCARTLKYSKVSIHSPHAGSYRDACEYLIHLSTMTRKINPDR